MLSLSIYHLCSIHDYVPIEYLVWGDATICFCLEWVRASDSVCACMLTSPLVRAVHTIHKSLVHLIRSVLV